MPTKKKLIGAAAFAAALAGGATAGALLGTPSVSSAQDDPSSSSSDAPSTDAPSTESDGTTTAPKDCVGGPRGGHGFFGSKLEAAATALGMTEDELRTEVEAGKSIATIAGEKGVDLQNVIDGIVAAATADIDQAVTDGELTQEQADELKAGLVERVTEFVNRTKPEGGLGKGRHGPRDETDDTTTDDTSGS